MTIPGQVVMTNADGLACNTHENAAIVLMLTRPEIESGHHASALERLLVMVETKEAARRYRESLFIVVSGYDSDQRELCEIPEVRQYFLQLVQEWPHWIWFLSRVQGMVSLFLSLISEVKVHRKSGAYGVEFVNLRGLLESVESLTIRSESLYLTYEITETEVCESVDSALAQLGF